MHIVKGEEIFCDGFVTLASFVGPAACYPASRDTVHNLFVASDDDNSNSIDLQEFETIMVRSE